MNSARRTSGFYPVAAGFALVCIFLSSRQAESDLFKAWQSEEYSHGMLIPLIALLLGWNILAEKRPSMRPSWMGLAVLLLAALFQLIAQLSAFEMAGELGLALALFALSLSFLGRPATRALIPAFFYLLFAIPLPHLIQSNLSAQMQLISSTLGVIPLELIGVPVYQEGNVIDLGNYRLQVAEACSGLRYLFPLMSFGYLIAFLLDDRMWKRLIIFLSTIPITIALNALRIAFIGFTVDLWGPKMAEGVLHAFEGWAVFLCCISLLAAETWILLRIGHRGQLRFHYLLPPRGFFSPITSGDKAGFLPPCGGGQERGSGGKGSSWFLASRTPPLTPPARGGERIGPILGFATACLVIAAIFASGVIEQREEIIPKRPSFATFPLSLDGWSGRMATIGDDVLEVLKPTEYLMADYMKESEAPVNLYIAYYERQRFGSQTHSPSNCIPGGGWHIEKSDVVKIDAGDRPLLVTRLLIRNGEMAKLVYYWFDERGRNLTETYSAKFYMVLDSVTMHRTDGALVRLITPIMPHEAVDSAEKRLTGFLRAADPQIQVFIPGSMAINAIAAP